MAELTYHNGHYHPTRDSEYERYTRRSSKDHSDGGLLRKTHDVWDKVLYGIGSAYYKLKGH
jgi:hypothetical protein